MKRKAIRRAKKLASAPRWIQALVLVKSLDLIPSLEFQWGLFF